MLMLDAHLSPRLRPWLQQGAAPGVNARAGLLAERVLSRRLSAGGSLGLFGGGSTYDWNNAQGAMRLRGHTASLFCTTYSFSRKGNIAPIGPFQRWELLGIRYRLQDLDRRFYPDAREDLGAYYDLALSVTAGVQHAEGGRFFWSAGLQCAWLMGLYTLESSPEELYLRQQSYRRSNQSLALNLRLGLGWVGR